MEKNLLQVEKSRFTTKDMIITGLLIALNYAAYNVHIQAPWGAMIHLGNVVGFAGAIVFGAVTGGLAGGLSAMIFDLLTGHSQYALWSLVIKGLGCFVLGSVAHMKGNRGQNLFYNILGIILCGVVNLVGYFISWLVLLGFAAAVSRIPSSIISTAVGFASIPVAAALGSALRKSKLI